MKHRHVVAALERIHHGDDTPFDAWLSDVCAHLFPMLDEGACLSASMMSTRGVEFSDLHGAPPDVTTEFRRFTRAHMTVQVTPEMFEFTFRRPSLVRQWSELEVRGKQQTSEPYMQRMGAVDAVAITLEPVVDTGLAIIAGQAISRPITSPERAALTRVALHVETAVRARLGGAEVLGTIDARGSLEMSGAPTRAVREGLASDVALIETARTLAHRDDGAHALSVWRALSTGQMSLRERTDPGGRRYYEILENPPHHRALRALGERQAQVVEYASRGVANKEIGYALGLSSSYVSILLREAALKLGLADSRSLLRATSTFASARPEVTWNLTPAEHGVARLLAEGLSNRQIAARRGVAERTVANQVASVLAKTGSGNRRALLGRST